MRSISINRVVLRYVEPEISSTREDFVIFLECGSGTTSEALADQILGFIISHLDPSKMGGQAYDGASNMSDKTNGTAATISSVYPLALYTHCASHSLNLASGGSRISRRGVVIQSCAQKFRSHTHLSAKPRPFRSFLRQTTSPTCPIDLFSNEFSF